MRVLLVESDPDLLQLGWAILTGAGHEVVAIGTVEEAIVYCDGPEPVETAVINLVNSPTMRGVELARQIAERKPDAAVTVTCGGIRTLPRDMPASVRLVPKPLTAAAFHEAAVGWKRADDTSKH